MKRPFAGLALMVALSSLAIAADFRHQDWFGEEDWDREVCRMSNHIQDGYFFVAQEDWQGKFWIGVQSSRWQVGNGFEIAGAVSFDSNPPMLLTGKGYAGGLLLFSARSDVELKKQFMSKRVLRLSYGDSWATIPLRGSARAANLLSECAERVWPGAGDDEEAENFQRRQSADNEHKEAAGEMGAGVNMSKPSVTDASSDEPPLSSTIIEIKNLIQERGCIDASISTEICKAGHGFIDSHVDYNALNNSPVCLAFQVDTFRHSEGIIRGSFQGRSGAWAEEIYVNAFVGTTTIPAKLKKGDAVLAHGRLPKGNEFYGNSIDSCFIQFDLESIQYDGF